MGIHDVVIKVRRQVVTHNLTVSMLMVSMKLELLKVHVDPGACPLTCLQGILARLPQVGRILHRSESSQPIEPLPPAGAALEDH